MGAPFESPPFGSHLESSRQKEKDPAVERQKRREFRGLLADAELLNARLAAAAGDDDAAAAFRRKAVRLPKCESGMWGRATGGGQIVRPGGEVVAIVEHCKHRLCPHCARKRAANLNRQLTGHLEAEGIGERFNKFLTFTQRNRRGEPLKDALARLVKRWDKFRRRKFWSSRVEGSIAAFEVTWNPVTRAWHPHIHVTAAAPFIPQAELLKEWRKGIDADDDGQVRDGGARIEAANAQGAIRETVKYVAKGVDLAPTCEEDQHELFALEELVDLDMLAEACRVLANFKLLRTYGTARGRAELDEDDDWKEHREKLDELAQELLEEGYVGWDIISGRLVSKERGKWGYRAGHEYDLDGWAVLDAGAIPPDDWQRVPGKPHLTPFRLDQESATTEAERDIGLATRLSAELVKEYA